MDRLRITFARNGIKLVWTVSDGHDSDDFADCSPRRGASFSRVLSGRRVYYEDGNHGDSAWTCLTRQTSSGTALVGIDVWIANDAGRPSPLTVMRMVATARPA